MEFKVRRRITIGETLKLERETCAFERREKGEEGVRFPS